MLYATSGEKDQAAARFFAKEAVTRDAQRVPRFLIERASALRSHISAPLP
jgi:hypothetical protein